jgi:D-threo-aldose 1-dehydrogenase
MSVIAHLPPIGIGTGSFSGLYRDVPEEEAIATIHYALDHAIPLVDTAPWYGAFVAERYVGAALATRPKNSYILSTKACLWLENGEAARGYTRDQVLWSFEGSLKRLQTDQVDILHIHDPQESEYRTIIEQTYATLAELKAQGVIQAIGCGTGDWQILAKLSQDVELDCGMLAGRYTLLEQPALDMLNRFYERGIPLFSAGIYNSGILATGSVAGAKYNYSDAPEPILARVRAIEEVCARHNVPLKAAAAQFVRAHPAITTIVLGVESPEQVAENAGVFTVAIPTEFWEDLRAAQLIPADAPTPKSDVQ